MLYSLDTLRLTRFQKKRVSNTELSEHCMFGLWVQLTSRSAYEALHPLPGRKRDLYDNGSFCLANAVLLVVCIRTAVFSFDITSIQ